MRLSMISSYAEAVELLYGRINYERLGTEQYTKNDLKLERMGRLLAALGNPHLRIPVVHVAGTKGKGTTCTLTAEILKQAGYRVGLYTSPHQYRIEERLVVNGQLPTEAEFVSLVNRLLTVLSKLDQEEPGQSPTFFECVNALAWLHFEQQQVDLAVLEVGLGGRLDSTNLCRPLVTVITCISYDHTRILGNTLRQIASEKAGIIKAGVPVICGAEATEAQQQIHQQAAAIQAPLIQSQTDFRYRVLSPWNLQRREQQVQIETHTAQLELSLKSPGVVYAENAALAVACVEELVSQGYKIRPEHIQQAALSVSLPLRFEIVNEAPLLIADAAHNPASIRALATTLQQTFPDRPVTLLLAVSKDKDYQTMCRELRGIQRVMACQYQGNERTLPVDHLVQTLQQEYTGLILKAETPEIAWATAQESSAPNEVFVATGSLFFAAEIKHLALTPRQASLSPTV